jgi:hypothetical protein
MAKYLTLDGLSRFYAGIKEKLAGKVDVVSGKGLSTNDLTAALKNNYDAAYTHSQAAHAPSGAQANVIETVKVNGTILTPTAKAVDVSVPTKTSALTNDSGYITSATTGLTNYYSKSEIDGKVTSLNTSIANAVSGKLSFEIVSTLPAASSASTSVIYLVPKSASDSDNAYDEYMLIKSAWEKIGDTKVDLSGYLLSSDVSEVSNTEIDSILAS